MDITLETSNYATEMEWSDEPRNHHMYHAAQPKSSEAAAKPHHLLNRIHVDFHCLEISGHDLPLVRRVMINIPCILMGDYLVSRRQDYRRNSRI